MEICRKLRGKDCVIEFDYKVTSKGCSAQTYGPPENCYPAEPMEYEITGIIGVHEDLPGSAVGQDMKITAAEREEIMEWLETYEKVYEKISEHESDYNDDYGDCNERLADD